MFNYYWQISLANISRQKGLSSLIVFTLGLGISACMLTYGLLYLLSKDPLPNKSELIYRIQLDNWPKDQAAIEPDLPPEQITWRDSLNIVQANLAKNQAANALTWGMVTPDDKNTPPFLAITRATHGEFFSMFDVPFLYGQGWPNSAQNQIQFITVLSKATNERVFAGENSVGKTLPMLGQLFTVVGVLDDWQPSPKFYDLSFGPFSQAEDVYIPLQVKAELELPHGGSSHCFETHLADTYQAFLNSECVNFNLWVEFSDPLQKQQFEQFLTRYIGSQKSLGRFPKSSQATVLSLKKWLEYKQIVNSDIYLFFYMAVLFLLVCMFNAGSLISQKLTAQSNEIALRRALGASQISIFMQCITETLLLGIMGAVVGGLLSIAGFEAIKQLYPNFAHFNFVEPSLMLLTVLLSLMSCLIAGLIPSVATCALSPAEGLK